MPERGKHRRCYSCKQRLKVGDTAYEVKLSRINVKGTRAMWSNIKVLICEPCNDTSEITCT